MIDPGLADQNVLVTEDTSFRDASFARHWREMDKRGCSPICRALLPGTGRCGRIRPTCCAASTRIT
jgi:hypothetical protein